MGFFTMLCSCSSVASSFKNMDFTFNGKTVMSLSPYGYLEDIGDIGNGEYCFVAFGQGSSGQYLLGDTFLRHFYFIVDYELQA